MVVGRQGAEQLTNEAGEVTRCDEREQGVCVGSPAECDG